MKQFSLQLITATVAVIIAVLSYGLMSFGTGENFEFTINDELRWFIVEPTPSGYSYSSSNPHMGLDEPQIGCNSPEDTEPLCSVAFPLNEVNPSTGLPFETNPENASPLNKRYQEE